MIGQDLHHSGLGEGASDEDARHDKWQRHVMAGLWVCLAIFLAAVIGLMIGEDHGLFGKATTPERTAPTWPGAWP
jgi:hypothetical protein